MWTIWTLQHKRNRKILQDFFKYVVRTNYGEVESPGVCVSLSPDTNIESCWINQILIGFTGQDLAAEQFVHLTLMTHISLFLADKLVFCQSERTLSQDMFK